MTENIDVVTAETITTSDDVELTIRQAYQAENDLVFSCPTDWTIKQVKEHVRNCLDSHPAVSTQRIIFSGAPLHDDMILSNILKERSHVPGEQIFFHLMISQPYQAPAEVRRRNVNGSGQTPQTQPIPNSAATNAAYAQNMAAWQQYWQAYNQLPAESQIEEHQRLMAYYYAFASMTPPTAVVYDQNQQQPNAGLFRGLLNRAPVEQAPNVPPQPVNNNNGGGRVDILEVGYRIFKVVLLFSAILLYSSFERFAVVLCAALFIYFIQLRRNHARNRAHAQAQAQAQQANQEPHVNNNNNGENEPENTNAPAEENGAPVAPDAPTEPQIEQQSGMQLFLATCYSFVTSFFASLVPDHPMPMDLN